MSSHAAYLRHEIATLYARGRLSRRQALARLTAFGLGAVAASALLAACAPHRAPAPPRAPAAGPAPVPLAPMIELTRADGVRISAAFAAAATPRGAVLVIHGGMGLGDHIAALVTRFADAGYTCLAVDLLSEDGGTAALAPDARFAALGDAGDARLIGDLRAGLDELARRAPGVALGVVGFCMGGGLAWDLLAIEPRIAAAVPFYGPTAADADFSRSRAAVLAIYAELDTIVTTRDLARAALERAGLAHEVVTYPGVDHAFFDDSYEGYDAAAATDAWQRTLAWLGKYLGPA